METTNTNTTAPAIPSAYDGFDNAQLRGIAKHYGLSLMRKREKGNWGFATRAELLGALAPYAVPSPLPPPYEHKSKTTQNNENNETTKTNEKKENATMKNNTSNTNENAKSAAENAVAALLKLQTFAESDGAALAQVREQVQTLFSAIGFLRRDVDILQQNGGGACVKISLPSLPAPREIKCTVHPALSHVLTRVNAGINCYLHGPTGSGKTHLARQVCAALFGEEECDTRFAAISVSGDITTGDIWGRLSPVESDGAPRFEFCETDILRVYRDGGVILFDELDGGAPEVLLSINAALANGWLQLPGRPRILRNPKTVILAAGNTCGAGATRSYTGRTRLDAATLNRFRFVAVDYDVAMEKKLVTSICGEDGARVVCEARDKARAIIAGKGLDGVFFSTRTALDYAKMYAAGITKTALEILRDFANPLPPQQRAFFG